MLSSGGEGGPESDEQLHLQRPVEVYNSPNFKSGRRMCIDYGQIVPWTRSDGGECTIAETATCPENRTLET